MWERRGSEGALLKLLKPLGGTLAEGEELGSNILHAAKGKQAQPSEVTDVREYARASRSGRAKGTPFATSSVAGSASTPPRPHSSFGRRTHDEIYAIDSEQQRLAVIEPGAHLARPPKADPPLGRHIARSSRCLTSSVTRI